MRWRVDTIESVEVTVTTALGNFDSPRNKRQIEHVRQVADVVTSIRRPLSTFAGERGFVRRLETFIRQSRGFSRDAQDIVTAIENEWSQWPQDTRDWWAAFAKGHLEREALAAAAAPTVSEKPRKPSLWVIAWFLLNRRRLEQAVASTEDSIFWVVDAVLTQMELHSDDHNAVLSERLAVARGPRAGSAASSAEAAADGTLVR